MAGGHEIAMALRSAYLSMHRQADAALSPYDLTANQFVMLALLDARDRVPQRDLVQRASSDQNTIRPMLTALEKKGLVDREPDPSDGRVWLVRLTAKGRRTYRRVRTKTELFREQLTSNLTTRECEVLERLLGKVVEAMTDDMTQGAD
jgi:DNA-binding MarR family transcriptional regulator